MKYIYNNINKLFLAFLLFGFVASCSEDFVDLPPEGANVEPGDLTQQSADRLVTGVYNPLYSWEISAFSALGMGSIASDDADKGSSPGDTGSDKHELDAFTFTPTGPSFRLVWQGNNKAIKRANFAIEAVTSLEGIDEGWKNQRLGELRFLRAYYYFNLAQAFGDVPLIDRPLDPTVKADLDALYTRVPRVQVWQFIEDDLNFAKDNLAQKGGNEVGRVTSGAAAALLAKTHLYQNDFQAVLDLTNALISGTYGSYTLHPKYEEIWREIGENNSGSIWEIQCSPDDANNRQAIQQYTEPQGVRGQFGWGFNSPSESLNNEFETGDPRREATMIYPNEVMWDGVQINESLPNPRYSEKMYVSRVAESYVNNGRTNKNKRNLRYADVLLWNAEAANELGQQGQALMSLELVRNRARGGDMSILPEVTTTNKEELRAAIYHERRVEFGMEWDRYYDVVRQGRGAEVLGPLGFQSGKHELFPVPQQEIDASEGLMSQNPGY